MIWCGFSVIIHVEVWMILVSPIFLCNSSWSWGTHIGWRWLQRRHQLFYVSCWLSPFGEGTQSYCATAWNGEQFTQTMGGVENSFSPRPFETSPMFLCHCLHTSFKLCNPPPSVCMMSKLMKIFFDVHVLVSVISMLGLLFVHAQSSLLISCFSAFLFPSPSVMYIINREQFCGELSMTQLKYNPPLYFVGLLYVHVCWIWSSKRASENHTRSVARRVGRTANSSVWVCTLRAINTPLFRPTSLRFPRLPDHRSPQFTQI